jgi:hypothetical protein
MDPSAFAISFFYFFTTSILNVMNFSRITLAFAAFCAVFAHSFAAANAQNTQDASTQTAPPQESSTEVLFSGNTRFGGYGGPVVKFSPFKGQLATWVGGYGGVLIDGTLFIGGGGYGMTSNIAADPSIANGYSVGVGYGGAMIEYIGNSDKLLHYGVSLLIGGGIADYIYRPADGFSNRVIPRGNSPYAPATYFVLEPGAYAEVNLARWFRIAAGVSYRYANGGNSLPGITGADLSNVSGNLIFKFGRF